MFPKQAEDDSSWWVWGGSQVGEGCWGLGHVIPLQVHHSVLLVQLCQGQDKSWVEGEIGACSTVGDTPGLTLITLWQWGEEGGGGSLNPCSAHSQAGVQYRDIRKPTIMHEDYFKHTETSEIWTGEEERRRKRRERERNEIMRLEEDRRMQCERRRERAREREGQLWTDLHWQRGCKNKHSSILPPTSKGLLFQMSGQLEIGPCPGFRVRLVCPRGFICCPRTLGCQMSCATRACTAVFFMVNIWEAAPR